KILRSLRAVNQILVPIISVHSACQKIACYLSKDKIIDLVNAYIMQYHLDTEKVKDCDDRYGWQILCDTINAFPEENKLDFIKQTLDAGYIPRGDNFDFISKFVEKYNYSEVQEKLFEQLAIFSSNR